MKNLNLKYFKSSLILLVLFILFTLFFFIPFPNKSLLCFSSFNNISSSNTLKKSLIDLTGDGIKETVEVIQNDTFYDVKITSTSSTTLLSSLTSDNKLCSSEEGSIFKLRFINLSRDNKPELLIQGVKDGVLTNFIFSYNKNFELILTHSNNICGLIDSNMVKTPQLVSLNYIKKKENIKSNMLVNNELLDINSTDIKFPGIDNVISLIDYINLDAIIDSHPDIFTDTISSSDLSNLWKLDKSFYTYSFKCGFFFDSTLDDKGNILESTYILSFSKKHKKDGTITPFDVEVKLNKSYYNDLRISEMRFFSHNK
ncbi:MAG: hypothetical protein ACRC28_18200 [Clostridium sp.]|uniref:hypothetical protein n=1 Tax=Clostridium sp. TaxID=1506 RepID=UPI003F2C801B